MGIEDIKVSLQLCIDKPENNSTEKELYCSEVLGYLEENGLDNDVLDIIIDGFFIDNGTVFINFWAGKEQKKLKMLWRVIDNNIQFNRNKNGNSLKLLAGILSAEASKKKCRMIAWEKIIPKIVNISKTRSDESNQYIDGFDVIIKEYFVEKMPVQPELPELANLSCKIEDIAEFCQILHKVLSLPEFNEKKKLKDKANILAKWLQIKNPVITEEEENTVKEKIEDSVSKDVNYKLPINSTNPLVQTESKVKEAIKKVEIDEKDKSSAENAKPKKRKSEELSDLARHFRNIENNLEKASAEIEEKKKEITQLQAEISKLDDMNGLLQVEARLKEKELKGKDVEISNLIEKLNESQNLNKSFDVYMKDSESELLKDISAALKNEYEDFIASENDEMDEVLGEIYREKIKMIFKILSRKGIKMEK